MVEIRALPRLCSRGKKTFPTLCSSRFFSLLCTCWVLVAALSSLVAATDTTTTVDKDYNLLMIGNKLANEDKLENMVEELLREGYGLENYSNGNNKKGRVYANRFEMSGFKLKEYLSNYSLITQTIIGKAWDWVILQEQSEIPGFYDLENMEEEYFSDSVDSIQVMNTMISRSNHGNAQTVLLMTWGHRDGDDRNAKIYPNYIEMQRRITTGYYKYFAEVSSDRRPVKIIPAGLAFQKQYQDNIDVFNALYDTDGRHLTPQGMYLVACVIYDTITGKQTQGMTWKPVAITEAMRDQYQTLADTTVASFDDQYLRALPKAAGTEENGKRRRRNTSLRRRITIKRMGTSLSSFWR